MYKLYQIIMVHVGIIIELVHVGPRKALCDIKLNLDDFYY